MRRRLRTRRVLKWTGTVVCVLIAVACVVSLWWSIGYENHARNPAVDIYIKEGWFCFWSVDRSFLSFAWTLRRIYRVRDGWNIDRLDATLPATPLWAAPNYARGRGVLHVAVPLWIPLLAALLPTLTFWHLDRRRFPSGHCQRCGYNLTGNVSGRCPECREKT